MQVSKELEEASTVCGTGWLATQRRITLPILMPMLVAVGLMTFVTAVNEVSGVVLLASTDTRTLSLLSLGYLTGSFSEKESAAVVTTIMILLCVGVALVARQIEERVGNRGPGTAAAFSWTTRRFWRSPSTGETFFFLLLFLFRIHVKDFQKKLV